MNRRDEGYLDISEGGGMAHGWGDGLTKELSDSTETVVGNGFKGG